MLRPQVPDPELIAWMNSEAGTAWMRGLYKGVQHSKGAFGEVKDDHECRLNLDVSGGCSGGWGYTPMHDDTIKSDMSRLGISGVPDHWKREWLNVVAGYKSS